MGLTMNIGAASDAQIEKLSCDAAALDNFVRGSGWDAANQAALQAILSNLPDKNHPMNVFIDMFGLRQKSSQAKGLGLDLDKSFGAVHYLLCGRRDNGPEPYCYLQHGGRVIGQYQREFEVRAISSSQVVNFESALQAIDRAELLRRYDVRALAADDVYPSGLWDSDDIETFNYIYEKFDALKALLRSAKNQGLGLIMCVH